MEKETMWIVALVGEHVHHGHANQCVISDLNMLDEVRDRIKNTYGLEFSEYSSSSYSLGYRKYDNISDDRDIALVVETINVFYNLDDVL